MRDEGARALLPVLDGLELRLAGIQERHPGYVIEQTGLLPVHVRTIDRLVSTLARSLVFAIPVIFLTLAFAFRSLRLAMASVIPNALPLVSIAVYLVATDWHVGIAGALSFTVALGIAVDDTIHFIDRYRRSCATESTADAIESAWSSLAGVMLVTTAILIAGFGTLAWSEFTGVRYFGGLSCLALVVAAVGDLIVLPAWLARFVPASRLR
jgi:predicted RND superfamily exporter protein